MLFEIMWHSQTGRR